MHAARLFEQSAKNEYTKAQYPLGNLYEKGTGVSPDYKRAATLYRLAVEKGHSAAQYELGLLHYGGKGVKRDYVQAYIWTNLGANKGSKLKRRNDPVHLVRDFMAQQMTPKQIKQAKMLEAKLRKKLKLAKTR
ncbi:MAG: tetratricopeptide repeat protein [Alphaproteobacteria bacterium]